MAPLTSPSSSSSSQYLLQGYQLPSQHQGNYSKELSLVLLNLQLHLISSQRYDVIEGMTYVDVELKFVEEFSRRRSTAGSPRLPSQLPRPPPPPAASTVPAHVHVDDDHDHSGTVGDVALVIFIVFDIFVLGNL